MSESHEDIILCSCGAHGVAVHQVFDEPNDEDYVDAVSMILWYMGEMGRLPFRQRLRKAIEFLFTGKLFQEEFVLEPEAQRKLIEAIKRESKQEL